MNFGKGINEEEILDPDSARVAGLLSALPRVEAPANFEFGVKAKIANGRVVSRAGFISFLKLAAPMSLLLVVGAFIFFYATLPSQDQVTAVEPVAPASDVRGATSETPDSVTTVEPENVSGPRVTEVEPERAAVPARGAVNRVAPRRGKNANDGGTSNTFTQKSAKVIMPPGLESANPRNPNTARIPVQEFFKTLGMASEFGDGGWKVSSVNENSVAKRSGVQANDVIVAIDGKEMKKNSAVAEIKSIRVRRDGKMIEMTLK